ncbi:hypothetical protein NT6N_26820 [Oceaniferula spumae]|uniref:Methyltransferase FkbM domain-containing protein n=1 Tax=Oceaniferula spumae TaxID=2979115 RepID=A0AAT9FNE3_9BACT
MNYKKKITTLKRAWRTAKSGLLTQGDRSFCTKWWKFSAFHLIELFSSRSMKFKDGLGIVYYTPIHNTSSYITYAKGFRDYNVYMFYKNWLQPSDCAIDVGANVGTHFVPIAKILAEGGIVIGYEVDCEVCSLLDRTCVSNKIKNAIIRCCAASDKGGVINLSRNLVNRGQTSVIRTGDLEGLVGSAVRLDDDVEPLIGDRDVNLMKIDVEGHEAEVIRGATKILTRSGRIAVVMEHFKGNDNEAPKLLSDLGFSPFNALKTGKLESSSDGFGDNIVWVKNTVDVCIKR